MLLCSRHRYLPPLGWLVPQRVSSSIFFSVGGKTDWLLIKKKFNRRWILRRHKVRKKGSNSCSLDDILRHPEVFTVDGVVDHFCVDQVSMKLLSATWLELITRRHLISCHIGSDQCWVWKWLKRCTGGHLWDEKKTHWTVFGLHFRISSAIWFKQAFDQKGIFCVCIGICSLQCAVVALGTSRTQEWKARAMAGLPVRDRTFAGITGFVFVISRWSEMWLWMIFNIVEVHYCFRECVVHADYTVSCGKSFS